LKSIKGKRLSEDLGIYERKILKRILGKRVGGCGLGSSGLGQGPVAGSCEHGNELCGFIKEGEFIYQLSDYKILKILCSLELVMSLVKTSPSILPSQVPRQSSYILLKELVNYVS
jgi:hypothetical protein